MRPLKTPQLIIDHSAHINNNYIALCTFNMLYNFDTKTVSTISPWVHPPHNIITTTSHWAHTSVTHDGLTWNMWQEKLHLYSALCLAQCCAYTFKIKLFNVRMIIVNNKIKKFNYNEQTWLPSSLCVKNIFYASS